MTIENEEEKSQNLVNSIMTQLVNIGFIEPIPEDHEWELEILIPKSFKKPKEEVPYIPVKYSSKNTVFDIDAIKQQMAQIKFNELNNADEKTTHHPSKS